MADDEDKLGWTSGWNLRQAAGRDELLRRRVKSAPPTDRADDLHLGEGRSRGHVEAIVDIIDAHLDTHCG
jgi:hypothetical protein